MLVLFACDLVENASKIGGGAEADGDGARAAGAGSDSSFGFQRSIHFYDFVFVGEQLC